MQISKANVGREERWRDQDDDSEVKGKNDRKEKRRKGSSWKESNKKL